MTSMMNPTVKKEVPDDQDQEKHGKPRNFSFSLPNKKPYAVSGTMFQTVLEALESSEKFKSRVEKNRGKDLLIVRKKPHHADIATHFPCCLIEEGEELTVRLSLKTSVPEPDNRATIPEEQLVTFYVSRAGGPNFKRKHLKNMRNQDIPYLCVYAYRGETVREALERDGRFEEIAYGEGSELSGIEDSLSVEMCYKVNESLDGKRYRLKREKPESNQAAGSSDSGSIPPDQEAGPSDSGFRPADQAAGPLQEQAKSTPESEESGPVKPPMSVKKKLIPGHEKLKGRKPRSGDHHPIPGSEELLKMLRSQVEDLLEIMKKSENLETDEEVLELLMLEFGKNTEPFWDVETGERLMKMSKSVCHIFNKESGGKGTGFLLFDHFILTNAHLIQKHKIGAPVKIIEPRAIDIHVDFNYDPSDKEDRSSNVESVVFGAYGRDEEMGYLDYALLKLSESFENLPPPLLKQYFPSSEKGGVCIFGHPEAQKKKFDFCSLIAPEQRPEVIKKKPTRTSYD